MDYSKIYELEKEIAILKSKLDSQNQILHDHTLFASKTIEIKVKEFWKILTITTIAVLIALGTSYMNIKKDLNTIVNDNIKKHLDDITPVKIVQDIRKSQDAIKNEQALASSELETLLSNAQKSLKQIEDTNQTAQKQLINLINLEAQLKEIKHNRSNLSELEKEFEKLNFTLNSLNEKNKGIETDIKVLQMQLKMYLPESKKIYKDSDGKIKGTIG